MTRSRTLLRVVCLLFAMAVASCRADAPAPPPTNLRASGLVLAATPKSLVIRPGSSGRIRFRVVDDANLPVAGYPVDFAIDGGGDTASAKLSTARALTGASGDAVVEVIVGSLARNDRPAALSVLATCPGSTGAQADILVTTNAYSVEILPVPSDDLLGSKSVAASRLYFYDNSACADLDIHDVGASVNQARAPHVVAANTSFVFSGVAASGVHAVIGLGLDSAGTAQIGGCVDVPGTALIESETVRATLFMDHLFPSPSGTFLVASNFQLAPPPSALTTIRSAWQQWARCPLDPARLWIDCTIAALDTNPGASACIPVPGAVGTLGDLLLAKRGIVASPLSATLASASDTPCHGAVDSAGNPSLEYSVDALFSAARDALSTSRLSAFPTELAVLLDAIGITSRMTISQGNDSNSYWVRHDLLGLTFPDALSPLSFEVQTLGLTVTAESEIPASLKADQLSIPSHGFTLRLGTSARYAFEATSLKSRNVRDSAGLVMAVLGLAQWNDQASSLTGCAAMDAVACAQINRGRGCLLSACQAGLDALAQNLAAAFDRLDGDAIDFWLSGSAPVVDLDADGQADALGTAASAGGVSAGPGLWSAEMQARSGSYVTYGSWYATRTTAIH